MRKERIVLGQLCTTLGYLVLLSFRTLSPLPTFLSAYPNPDVEILDHHKCLDTKRSSGKRISFHIGITTNKGSPGIFVHNLTNDGTECQ